MCTLIRDEEKQIQWMNATAYLNERKDKRSRQIVFAGEKLDAAAVGRVREKYLGRANGRAKGAKGER
jgi:hypothetical protein